MRFGRAGGYASDGAQKRKTLRHRYNAMRMPHAVSYWYRLGVAKVTYIGCRYIVRFQHDLP
jgi:hypothetical protein